MAPRRLLLLLQLCAAVAAASSLLAACRPVDAALPPPPRDASATTGVPRTVADGDVAAAGVSRSARRLRALSDIPADAPADDYGYDTDIPAADGDIAAGAPAPAAGQSPPWTAPYVLLFLLAVVGSILVINFLVVGLILLANAVADLYAAAKTAHEKATRVRPLDQDAVEAAGH
ncbi:unnamed protein product [Urochloa humidicola]